MRFKRSKDLPKDHPQIGLPVNTETMSRVGGEAVQSKKMPRPTLAQIIEKKTWENDQLRRELEQERERYRASSQAATYITEEVGHVVRSLQEALVNLQQLNKEVGEDLFGLR